MQLSFDQPLQHWTAYEKDASLTTSLFSGVPDVQSIWEPARFGWAFTLGRALSAGTYLYNVDAPWDNALTHTAVHNTVSVDGSEQMRRVSRFLYLDWAPAKLNISSKPTRIFCSAP